MHSAALNEMLGPLLAAVGAPNGGADYAASLARNRHLQQLLTAKALEAAEERWPGFASDMEHLKSEPLITIAASIAVGAAEVKWPGFRELIPELIAKELEFTDKAGPVA